MARILIVDDEPDILFVLRVTLQASGFEVVEASDGQQALEMARQERLDLVITDLMMPVIDGHEVIRQLRSDPATAHLPIIVVSAKQDHPVEADVVLRKPWKNDELLSSVGNLLATQA